MNKFRVTGGVRYVWSIADNCYVTLEYWNWLETSRAAEIAERTAERKALEEQTRKAFE